MTSQYIYIIWEREFKNKNEKTFKIGRTTQHPNNRLKNYPKNSEIIFIRKVNNCFDLEKNIKIQLKSNFIQKKEYGTEYFYGDEKEIVKIVNDLIENENLIINNNDYIYISNNDITNNNSLNNITNHNLSNDNLLNNITNDNSLNDIINASFIDNPIINDKNLKDLFRNIFNYWLKFPELYTFDMNKINNFLLNYQKKISLNESFEDNFNKINNNEIYNDIYNTLYNMAIKYNCLENF